MGLANVGVRATNPRVEMLVREEIQRIPGKKIPQNPGPNARKVAIVCPFHADHNPSGTINLDDTKAAMGHFRCWSCGTSVKWNDLALRLGLRQITGKVSKKTAVSDYTDSKNFREDLFGDVDTSADRGLAKTLAALEEREWDIQRWRGFRIKFLQRMGVKYVYDASWKIERMMVAIPAYINGELEGIVRGEIEKPADYREPSYRNSPGKWSEERGLLFFDIAKRMMEKLGCKTVVLVEGPRDALRLLRNKIPAIAVLGALNWGDAKTFTFEMLGAENCLLMFDGDDAGEEATNLIYPQLKGRLNVKFMSLWKIRLKRVVKGEMEEYNPEFDPGNCPIKYIKQAKRYVESTVEE